jgi:hypothetical protein
MMLTRFFSSFLVMAVLLMNSCKATPVNLAAQGKSAYTIVLPAAPTKSERQAAQVLQQLIRDISGVMLPVQQEDAYKGAQAIYIGACKDTKTGLLGQAGEDGFIIAQRGANLCLGGNKGHTAEYAVYRFAEQYLGARKYDAGAPVLPKQTELVLDAIADKVYKPSFQYRESYYPQSLDGQYLNWHALQRFEDLWGLWGHSYFKLVPPQTCFATHPEYYAMVNGIRRATQLCLSNAQVLQLTISKLKTLMADNPDAEYWSVSPNDEGGYCTCELCRKVDAEEGSPAGSVIRFVNKVAQAFPKQKITTLAYGYTAHAPAKTKPASNVYVFVSSIDAYREQPLEKIPSADGFRNDLKGWAAITDNIFVWDYCTQFTNYLSPFPVLQHAQPDFKFLAANNVRGIFEQGSGYTYGDMAELNSYVQAHLLWDLNADVAALTKDFCNGYYGKAGTWVMQYLDKRRQQMEQSGRHLDIYGNPITDLRGYLSAEAIDAYDKLLEQAEQAVAGSAYEARVRRIRMGLDYAVLQQSRHYGVEQHGFLANNGGATYTVRPEWIRKVDNFVASCKAAGVKELSEAGLSPDQYQKEWQDIFARSWPANKALDAKVSLQFPFVEDYPAKGVHTLSDGMTGFNDFSYNWLCFYGADMVATMDMGTVKSFGAVALNFMDDQRHWIFLPKNIQVEYSVDGNDYKPLAAAQTHVMQEQEGVKIVPHTFRSAGPVSARYIRVKAVNPGQMPPWRSHPTKKPIIACDEIMVLP